MHCCRPRWADDAACVKPESASAAPARSPFRRRWLRRLPTAAALLLGAAGLAYWSIPAERVVDLLLARIGPSLSLDFKRNGTVAWHLRGGPLLEIHGLDISDATTHARLLHAKRALIALPWSTLRRGGGPLQLTRIELDSPHLNLPALARWLDARTPTGNAETALPAITHGVRIVDGRVDGAGWSIQDFALELPQLAADARVRATASARYVDAKHSINGTFAVAMTRPAPGAGAAIIGTLALRRDDLEIPLELKLSGALHPTDAALRITPLRLTLNGQRVRTTPEPALAFALELAGAAEISAARLALAPVNLNLSGTAPLPALHASGEAVLLGEMLQFNLSGELPHWPAGWPALPAPLKQPRPFEFSLTYSGAADLTATLDLHLQQTQTRLETRLRLPVLLAWLDANADSPLPPLQGRVSMPLLELSGARLRGIELDMDADTAQP